MGRINSKICTEYTVLVYREKSGGNRTLHLCSLLDTCVRGPKSTNVMMLLFAANTTQRRTYKPSLVIRPRAHSPYFIRLLNANEGSAAATRQRGCQ
jgi:hypothetical protein